MANYTATISWRRGEGEAFTDNRYGRSHEWAFDSGVRPPLSRHSSESWNPAFNRNKMPGIAEFQAENWTPAFAGVTEKGK